MTLPLKIIEQKPRKNHQDGEASWGLTARRTAVSAGAGFALLALLCCAAAALCLRFDLPQERMGLVAIPLAGLAAFAAGYLNVRPVRRQGMVLGMLAAAALYLPVLAAALVISRAAPGLRALVLLLAMLLCGAAGGIVAANRAATPSRYGTKTRKR